MWVYFCWFNQFFKRTSIQAYKHTSIQTYILIFIKCIHDWNICKNASSRHSMVPNTSRKAFVIHMLCGPEDEHAKINFEIKNPADMQIGIVFRYSNFKLASTILDKTILDTKNLFRQNSLQVFLLNFIYIFFTHTLLSHIS